MWWSWLDGAVAIIRYDVIAATTASFPVYDVNRGVGTLRRQGWSRYVIPRSDWFVKKKRLCVETEDWHEFRNKVYVTCLNS
jgi:hypothetical protein